LRKNVVCPVPQVPGRGVDVAEVFWLSIGDDSMGEGGGGGDDEVETLLPLPFEGERVTCPP